VNRFLLLGFAAALSACASGDDSTLVDDGEIENAASDDERALLAGITVPKATPGTKLLVVQKGTDEVASGRGTVYDPSSTLYCDSDCDATTQEYPTGSTVTLVAQPEPGNAFMGWAGACSGTAETCTVTMSGTRAVVATFRARSALRVQPLGAAGKIKSRDGRIDCAPTCNGEYDYGAEVELTVETPPGVIFAGWEGVCSGAGSGPTCRLVLNQDTDVSAQFRNVVTVAGVGTGGGTTVSRVDGVDDGQINCGSVCSGGYPTGAQVSLVAIPAPGTIFDRWVSCPNPQGDTCVVQVTGPVTVSPWLRKLERQVVEVTPANAGSVEVTVNGLTLPCTGRCEYDVPHGADFSVRAVPGASSWFDRWDGLCAGRPDSCSVQPTAPGTHVARFTNRFRLTLTGDYKPISYRPTNGLWKSCASCTENYSSATTVELRTATSDDINCRLFSHWEGGGCSSTTSRCTVRVDRPLDVRAIWVDWSGCVPR
jgi:hypothetical protein